MATKWGLHTALDQKEKDTHWRLHVHREERWNTGRSALGTTDSVGEELVVLIDLRHRQRVTRSLDTRSRYGHSGPD